MSFLCCNSKRDCLLTAFVASLIVGVITAALSFTAVITVTPAFLWVLFGIAVVYLALTPLLAVMVQRTGARSCLRSSLPVLLTGILGTILTSVVLLAIEFGAASLATALITGALLAFFALIVTSVACLAICIANSQTTP